MRKMKLIACDTRSSSFILSTMNRGKWKLLKWKILASECQDFDTFFGVNFSLFCWEPSKVARVAPDTQNRNLLRRLKLRLWHIPLCSVNFPLFPGRGSAWQRWRRKGWMNARAWFAGALTFGWLIDKYLFETLGLQRKCRVHKDYMITPYIMDNWFIFWYDISLLLELLSTYS